MNTTDCSASQSAQTETAQLHRLLTAQLQQYPAMQPQDVYKLLHQRTFGPGHLVNDAVKSLARLRQELLTLQTPPHCPATLFEPIGNGMARLSLSAVAATGLSVHTLNGMLVCCAGARGSVQAFEAVLGQASALCAAGGLPLDAKALDAFFAAQKALGYPACHHSETFRAAYNPAYRVVEQSAAEALALFARIDGLLAKRGNAVVALEGGAGSGKTTLAKLLQSVYSPRAGGCGCTVLAMDDFFLRQVQRTPERLAQVGQYIDHERFLDEALLPLRLGAPFAYRPYDCQKGDLGEKRRVSPAPLRVVEGVYCMHPALDAAGCYDLRVFLEATPAQQHERLAARCTPEQYARFCDDWLPREAAYFAAFDLPARCDLRLQTQMSNF